MIRLNLFMIWFLHFLSLLSVIYRYYRQNSSSRIIVVLVYTVSTLFLYSYIITNFFISRRGWEIGRQFKSSNNMEKKNQNEELQSRREFFKKAAKSALPILGVIVLASTPLLSKAETISTGCNGSCTDICQNSCSGGCYRSCVGSCSGGCNKSCQGQCYGSCYRSSSRW